MQRTRVFADFPSRIPLQTILGDRKCSEFSFRDGLYGLWLVAVIRLWIMGYMLWIL